MLNSLRTALHRCEGSAAVEFAVGAPAMLIGLVIVTDIGLAINERMNLDQAVRAGAEFAMHNVGDEATLEEMMLASATGAYGVARNNIDQSKVPAVDAMQSCECPDAPGAAVACAGALCAGDVPPSIYYDLQASLAYDGIFLPTFPLQTEIKVQLR